MATDQAPSMSLAIEARSAKIQALSGQNKEEPYTIPVIIALMGATAIICVYVFLRYLSAALEEAILRIFRSP